MPKNDLNRRTLLASVASAAVLSAWQARAAGQQSGAGGAGSNTDPRDPDGLPFSQEIRVRSADIRITDKGIVVISNPGLRASLEQNSDATLEFMRKRVPGLRAGDIGIDKQGRVLLSNPEAGRLIRELTQRPGDLNIFCS